MPVGLREDKQDSHLNFLTTFCCKTSQSILSIIKSRNTMFRKYLYLTFAMEAGMFWGFLLLVCIGLCTRTTWRFYLRQKMELAASFDVTTSVMTGYSAWFYFWQRWLTSSKFFVVLSNSFKNSYYPVANTEAEGIGNMLKIYLVLAQLLFVIDPAPPSIITIISYECSINRR